MHVCALASIPICTQHSVCCVQIGRKQITRSNFIIIIWMTVKSTGCGASALVFMKVTQDIQEDSNTLICHKHDHLCTLQTIQRNRCKAAIDGWS